MRESAKYFLFFPLFLMAVTAQAQKAVLIDDGDSTAVRVEQPEAKPVDEAPRSGRQPHFFGESETKEATSYESAYEMRSKRRVGVGAAAISDLGMLGGFLELNFAADDSGNIGFGGGPHYSSFAVNWKHVFGGRTISPYVALGISHWEGNSGQSFTDTTPSYLGDKFLTDAEKQSGKFSLEFINPAAGLQYNFLSGDYVGTAIFAQIMFVAGIRAMEIAPTGSFGALYYF